MLIGGDVLYLYLVVCVEIFFFKLYFYGDFLCLKELSIIGFLEEGLIFNSNNIF